MKIPLLLLLLICFTASEANELPIEKFSNHSDYLNIVLSPDGKHMLARIQNEGEISLVFLDAKSMKIIGGVRPRAGDMIHSAVWVSNKRVVYQFAEKTLRYDRPIPTGELFAINVDGSKQEMLYGARARDNGDRGTRTKKREGTYATPEIISVLENDEKNILILEHPWTQEGNRFYDLRKKHSIITKLNIYNGHKTKVELLPHPGATAIANKSGDISFIRWRDEKNEFHAAYRSNVEAPWTETSASLGIDSKLIPLDISNDGKQLLLVGKFGDKLLRTYIALDLESSELTPLFTNMSADINEFILDSSTNMPIVGISYPGKPEYHYVKDNELAKLHVQLVGAFSGQKVDITSATKDKKKLLLHVSSDVNPGEYYIFDTETMGANFVWANRSWLDPRNMSSMDVIQFTTEDDMPIQGYLTMPNVLDKGEKPPMVVIIHGGPHGISDKWQFDSEVQFLANRGYAVLKVNYRGSGGFGDVFERAGYREWGGKMIKDITDATKYVVEQGKVDGDRMCVYGGSYGGYAALMASVREPDLYKCTIGYVGIYDLNYAYTDTIYRKTLGGKNFFKKVIGTDVDQLAEFSPVNHAASIKSEVLLIHGEKDAIVSVVNAEAMLAAFETVGKKVPYINFGKSGHGVYDEKGRRLLYGEIEKFLDKNIGASSE